MREMREMREMDKNNWWELMTMPNFKLIVW
jgi:hypothetical protein